MKEGQVAPAGKLTVECQALVSLAEPGNLYKAFQDTFTATSVATQAKYLEQKLSLPVRAPPCSLAAPGRWTAGGLQLATSPNVLGSTRGGALRRWLWHLWCCLHVCGLRQPQRLPRRRAR